MTRREQIAELYLKILFRRADWDPGLTHYENSGLSLEEIANILRSSDEAKRFNRSRLLSILPQGVCAEIGVDEGFYARQILDINQPEKLFLIDCWDDHLGWQPDSGFDKDQRYTNIVNQFGIYSNVEIIKEYSVPALSKFNDNFFDWVYIDAEHTYQGSKNDLIAAAPKVKESGYICGHDYNSLPEAGFGVTQAVDEFVKENNYFLTFLTREDYYQSFVISKTEQAHSAFLQRIG